MKFEKNLRRKYCGSGRNYRARDGQRQQKPTKIGLFGLFCVYFVPFTPMVNAILIAIFIATIPMVDTRDTHLTDTDSVERLCVCRMAK
jgi:hypothetical protein